MAVTAPPVTGSSPSCLTPTPLLTSQDHLRNKPLALESLPRVLWFGSPNETNREIPSAEPGSRGAQKPFLEQTREEADFPGVCEAFLLSERQLIVA